MGVCCQHRGLRLASARGFLDCPSEAVGDLLHAAAQEEEGCSHTCRPGYSLSCLQMYFISTLLLVGRKPALVCVGGGFREMLARRDGAQRQSLFPSYSVNCPSQAAEHCTYFGPTFKNLASIFFLDLLRNQGVWWNLRHLSVLFLLARLLRWRPQMLG